MTQDTPVNVNHSTAPEKFGLGSWLLLIALTGAGALLVYLMSLFIMVVNAARILLSSITLRGHLSLSRMWVGHAHAL